jgi:aspartyl-tRNA(Asn)/glutamyl-tRNA(Gln) amidotransferase subunit B
LLRETLRQLGVSDVNMEEGSLRCDANISIRPVGDTTLGTKTELKNMNSFRFIEQGINAEIARQIALVESGERVQQETLHFDPRTGSITSLRSKEGSHDYRYFPEPDMPPVPVPAELLASATEARAAVELPLQREARYRDELGLHAESARLLAYRPPLAAYFERVAAADARQQDDSRLQQLANWIGNDLVRRLDAAEISDPAESKVAPAALAGLVDLVLAKTINRKAGEQILDVLVAEGGDPAAIVEAKGLAAVGGGDELRPIVQEALDANPDVVEKLKTGNMKPIGAIVGHVMKQTKGRADGGEVTKIVREILGL